MSDLNPQACRQAQTRKDIIQNAHPDDRRTGNRWAVCPGCCGQHRLHAGCFVQVFQQ